MTDVALERLARQTAESLERLRDWHTRGLIRGDEADAVADVERVRLIRFLLGRGFDANDIAQANNEQAGLLDRFLEVIYPWGPLPQYSFADLTGRARDPDLARRLWNTADLSEHEDGVSDDDFDALDLLTAAVDAGLPEDALLQLVRVYTDNLRRVADAEVRLFHFYVHERLRAQGLSPPEVVKAMEEIGNQLLAAVEPTVLYFHRKGWISANRDDLALHVSDAATASGPTDVPGQLMAAVVFADLARFTPMTEVMGDAAAAEVMQRFSHIVRTATGACSGRVVKQIGDEFMLVFFEPRAAVDCALQIDERAANESHFPAVRSGAHWGEVLYREGDYVGTTVNIASRLADQAGPHELVVTSTLAPAAEALVGIHATPLGSRPIKGLSDHHELFVIRREGREPGDRVVDPVCGMEMPIDRAAARLEIGGQTQGFCSNDCLQRYVAAPARDEQHAATPRADPA